MKNSKGFTLIELMVVVAIVGLALAIILVFGPPILRAYKWNVFARTTQTAITHTRMRAVMQGGKLDTSSPTDPYRVIARDVRLRFVAVDRGQIPRGSLNDPIPFGEYYFNDGSNLNKYPLRWSAAENRYVVEELRFLYELSRYQILVKLPDCSSPAVNPGETVSGLSAVGEVTFTARGYEKSFSGCRVYLRNPKRGQCYRYVVLPTGRVKEEEQTSPYDFGSALPPCSCP